MSTFFHFFLLWGRNRSLVASHLPWKFHSGPAQTSDFLGGCKNAISGKVENQRNPVAAGNENLEGGNDP